MEVRRAWLQPYAIYEGLNVTVQSKYSPIRGFDGNIDDGWLFSMEE